MKSSFRSFLCDISQWISQKHKLEGWWGWRKGKSGVTGPRVYIFREGRQEVPESKNMHMVDVVLHHFLWGCPGDSFGSSDWDVFCFSMCPITSCWKAAPLSVLCNSFMQGKTFSSQPS